MEIEKNKRLAVLILASGTGERFSSKVPKKFSHKKFTFEFKISIGCT